MPSTTASGYGTYLPSGIDPFPIESTLASIVGQNNPATAADMLGTYQIANQTSRANYDYALNQQHQFAKDALAQQLYEKQLSAAMEGAKTYGGISIAAAMDPTIRAKVGNLIPGIEGGLGATQQAGIAEHGAGAAQKLVQAGYPASVEDVRNLTRLPSLVQGVPEAEKVAGMHVAAAGAQANKPSPTSVNTTLPLGPRGEQHTISTSKVPAGNVETVIQEHNRVGYGILDRRGGNTSTTPSVPPAAGSAAPSAPTSGDVTLDTNSPEGRKAHGQAVKAVDALSKHAKQDPTSAQHFKDIDASRKGGTVYDVHKDGQGAYVRGASGNKYYLND